MGLNKKSLKADAIANLYRAAYFLARGKGEERQAITLLKKSAKQLACQQRLKFLLEKYSYPFKAPRDRLVLAEKVLDEYLLLK